MKIEEIKLHNFRNYKSQKFSFAAKGCLITGKNGIGKTNLLEAICYPAFGKSIRQSPDSDLVNFAERDFSIHSKYKEDHKVMDFTISYSKDGKSIKLNNSPIKRISELYNYLRIVYFSADDLDLVNGTRQKRRSFFDLAITQSSILYSDLLREYYRILEQRNSILKDRRGVEELSLWNEQYINKAIDLVNYRRKYLLKFKEQAEKILNHITDSVESVEIDYEASSNIKYEREWLKNYLQKIEEVEYDNGRSLIGPHLDEYNLKINSYSVKRYSSQGQRRSLVIALRFAQIYMIKENLRTSPIIIFDDALSELDEDRIKKILSLLTAEHQILIASPRIDNYREFNFPVIRLDEGQQDETK